MAKYIELEALVDNLNLLARHEDEYRRNVILGVVATIRATNPADVAPVVHGRWISVKDRLPKNDEIVIICTDKNFIYAGELIGDTWFLDNDSWTATVTHWMPLPQPPKGE